MSTKTNGRVYLTVIGLLVSVLIFMAGKLQEKGYNPTAQMIETIRGERMEIVKELEAVDKELRKTSATMNDILIRHDEMLKGISGSLNNLDRKFDEVLKEMRGP